MKKFFIFLIINFILWGPFLVVKNLTQAAAFPTVTPEILRQNPNYLFTYIQDLYNFGLGIVGMLALVMIVFGAVQYAVMSAASPDKKRDALNKIYSALWGLLLLFGAYLILKSINPQLVTLQISGVTSTTPVAEAAPQHSFCGADFKDFQKKLAECKGHNWTDNEGTKYFYYLFYSTDYSRGKVTAETTAAVQGSIQSFAAGIAYNLITGGEHGTGIVSFCLPFKTVKISGESKDITNEIYDMGYKICTN